MTWALAAGEESVALGGGAAPPQAASTSAKAQANLTGLLAANRDLMAEGRLALEDSLVMC